MAVEGVGSVIQNLADELSGQGLAAHVGTRVQGARDVGSGTPVEDTFTPSTQSNTRLAAQDAGIFQLSPGPLTTVAVGLLSAPAPPNAVQPAAPERDGTGAASNPGASAAQTTAASGAGANSVQDASSPAASAELQNKIRQLNASLPALGLTNNEIQQIDRIASMIKDFNPAAYTDLVSQFEALAQKSAQQNAAGTAPPSVAGSPTTPTAGSNPNSGGFQVQQILIQFADSQGTPSGQSGSGGQSSAVNPSLFNAPGLQVEQVQFTLTNSNGQTTQVQTPHQTASSGTTS